MTEELPQDGIHRFRSLTRRPKGFRRVWAGLRAYNNALEKKMEIKYAQVPGDWGVRYYDPRGRRIAMWQWGRLRKIRGVHVAKEYVGPYWISTAWLGLDHSFPMFGERANRKRKPIIFETMIFGPEGHDEWQDRCSTMVQARKMHRRGVAEARRRLAVDREHDKYKAAAATTLDALKALV